MAYRGEWESVSRFLTPPCDERVLFPGFVVGICSSVLFVLSENIASRVVSYTLRQKLLLYDIDDYRLIGGWSAGGQA
jgi:hypothetical protein